MNIEMSDNLKKIPEGIFTELNNKANKYKESGKKLYNLFVGTPDFEVFPNIKAKYMEALKDSNNFHYSLRDLPELIDAVKKYYKKRFGVTLNNDEIMSVPGSQEGVAHIGMALCNPGDLILIPNPGYPAYTATPFMSLCETYTYDLKEENNFLPDFDSIPEEISKRAKMMIISYPYNPVCAIAPDSLYRDLISYAKKYNIIIIHDNAYSDIIFDGNIGKSYLAFDEAKDLGVEFFSLSKSFNLTGARISFVVGNKDIISAYKLLRSQYDFGMFIPAQYAAIEALTMDLTPVKEQCKEYERRRDALCNGLNSIGWKVRKSEGTMFVWAKIPPKYKTSREFANDLLDKTGVFVTPGEAFGSLGEGYVRFALVLPVQEINNAIKSIDKSNILK